MVLLAKNKALADVVAATWMHSNATPVAVEVGLSGGVDSIVLTHLLLSLQKRLNFILSAVYVHHGLSSNADQWGQFCQEFCAQRNIPLRQEKVQLDKASASGLEAEAREKRYEVYAGSSAQIIALAHHNDDLNETVLMNLLRGGGVHSLAAMPFWRICASDKRLWRPLLEITKDQLRSYALENNLSFVEDESNLDSKFRRNWLRHSILPLLHEHIPHLQQHLSRSATLMQDAASILDEIAMMDLSVILNEGYFNCAQWKKLSLPRQKQALLRFILQKNLGTPRPESLIDFCRQLNQSKNKQIQWQLPHGMVYAYQDTLFVSQSPETIKIISSQVNSIETVEFTHGVLKWEKHEFGLPENIIQAGLMLQSRQSGEVITLNVGKKSVKKILQETKIPPFMREKWPLMFDLNGQCVSVVSICVSTAHGCKGGYLPCWQPRLR